MENIENISTSITSVFTLKEFRETFKKEDLDILKSGNISFCIDVLKKFGFNTDNINIENIKEINLDFETSNRFNLFGPKVNIYNSDNKLISKKRSNNSYSTKYGVENFEIEIFEELDFKNEDINEFISSNSYNKEYIADDICSLIHISCFELNLKNYSYYLNLTEQFKNTNDEKFVPLINKAKKNCYEYKELYITKSIADSVIKMIHVCTPYILNANRKVLSFTPEEIELMIEKTISISSISHTYEYDNLTLEDKNIKDNFMDLVTVELKNYKRYLQNERGYYKNNQIVSPITYSKLVDYLNNKELDLDEKIAFKVKVIGTEQILIENTLGPQKTYGGI